MTPIRFTVYGEAKPAGSKRAFVNPKTKRAIITDASGKGGKAWRSDVQAAALQAYGAELLDCPLVVSMTFYRQRPKSHYGSGRNSRQLKASAPLYPTTRPDLLKLARAIEDALTGLVYRDDALIVDEFLRGRYAMDGRPRVDVEIREIREAG